jgi:hypothetical protein
MLQYQRSYKFVESWGRTACPLFVTLCTWCRQRMKIEIILLVGSYFQSVNKAMTYRTDSCVAPFLSSLSNSVFCSPESADMNCWRKLIIFHFHELWIHTEKAFFFTYSWQQWNTQGLQASSYSVFRLLKRWIGARRNVSACKHYT